MQQIPPVVNRKPRGGGRKKARRGKVTRVFTLLKKPLYTRTLLYRGFEVLAPISLGGRKIESNFTRDEFLTKNSNYGQTHD
jgi:hypothetical protein